MLLASSSAAIGALAGSPSTQTTGRGQRPEPSVASLAAALESRDPQVRQRAVYDLFNRGVKALPARAALVRALKDEDATVRRMAAMCLVKAGDVDPATVRAFIASLEQDPSGQMVGLTLEQSPALLARFGRTACFGTCPCYTLYVLKDGTLLYWGHSFVKVQGARSRRLTAAELEALVGAFEDAGYSSLADHYYAMATDAPSIQLAFAQDGQIKKVDHDLSNPGPKPLQRLEQRFEEIAAPTPWVGTEDEREALERGKEDAARVARLDRAPALMASLQDPNPEARRRAAEELYATASTLPDPKRREWQQAASRVLAESLRDPSEKIRFRAASALRGAGSPAPEAVEALVKCLGDSSARVREEASWAIYQMGPAAKSAVPALLTQVTNPVFKERHLAVAVLGQIGPAAASAVPALARALGDSDARVRDAAASALSKIGPSAAGATHALADTLRNDSNAGVRRLAAWALWHIGPAASAAVPALKAALADPSPEVREEAALALKAIAGR
jgi:HEAT repeat protein